MAKKFVAGVILSAMVISSLSGCGKSEDKTETKKNTTESGTTGGLVEEKVDSTDDKSEEITSEKTDDNSSNEVTGDFRTVPNTPEEQAYVAYQEYLDDKGYKSCGHYNFEYIDNDEYPELLVEFPALGLSYKNGAVIELGDSLGNYFAYTKGTGYFLHMGAEAGTSTYEKITDGETEVLAYSIKEHSDDSVSDFTYKFFVGDNEVPEEKYNEYISSLGEFEYLSEASDARESMLDAYKAFKDLPEDLVLSDDEAWKDAYYSSYEFADDEYTRYYVIDPNKDGIPEVIMENVDGGRDVYYLDKFNKLNSLGYGNPVFEGNSGSIYISGGVFQEIHDRTITEYKYYAETGSWSAVNQFEIILDDDWNLRIPEGYNYSDNHLYKDSEYSSYKVNGKEYDSYDEAVNTFSQEYAAGDIKEVNVSEGNYEQYNYNNFRRAILDYGLETHEAYLFQVSEFEYSDGKLNIVADSAPKLELEDVQEFNISYPISEDCRWYDSTGYDVWGLTTYEKICKYQQEARAEYDSYGNTEENNVLESPRMLIIRIKDGVIIEVYLSHS